MFAGVWLEDTWVTGWHRDGDRLIVDVEAGLWPGHPAYEPPQPGKWTCYKRGRLVSGLPDEKNGLPPYTDASGSRDFGSVNAFRAVEGGYQLHFDLGDVRIECETASLELGAE